MNRFGQSRQLTAQGRTAATHSFAGSSGLCLPAARARSRSTQPVVTPPSANTMAETLKMSNPNPAISAEKLRSGENFADSVGRQATGRVEAKGGVNVAVYHEVFE